MSVRLSVIYDNIHVIIAYCTCFATLSGLIQPRSMSTVPVLHAVITKSELLLLSHK